MPISADQWRAVTGLNNVRRPRQVGIKPRYMQQETYGDNDKLSHHPEPDTTKDKTGGGARSKRSRIKKGSRRKDRSRRPERDKYQDDSTISIRAILWPSVLALCLAMIVPSLNLTVCGANVNDIFITPGAAAVIGDNSTIPGVFESSSVMGVQLLQSFISVVVMILLLLSGDVETNPGPTTILSMDKHFIHVKHVVWGARAQWKNIGRSLPGLSEGAIQSINEPHDGECLHMVLSLWMKTDRATINDLLKALEDITVGHRDIADEIRALNGRDRINIGLEPDTDNPQPQVLSMDKHFIHVKHVVWGARAQWKNIGRSLPGLSEGAIQSINEPHDGECLHMVLSLWMKTDRATINDLLKALEDITVGHRDIADEIRALNGRDRINIGLEPDTDNPQPQDTDQRINDIAKRQGLDPSQLDVPCDKSHLLPISQLLVHWLSYCEYLGLTALQKNHIRTDQSLTAAHQKPEEMLKRWQEICADSKKSHYRYLLRGCIEINDNAQLVAVICDVIAKNPIEDRINVGLDPDTETDVVNPQPHLGPPVITEQPVDKTAAKGNAVTFSIKAEGTNLKYEWWRNETILKEVDHYSGVSTPRLSIVNARVEQSGQYYCVVNNEGGRVPSEHAKLFIILKNKMWPKEYDVLYVYFMNPEVLPSVGLDIKKEIMDLAQIWELPNYPNIPKFRETKDLDKAHVRVQVTTADCWSKTGTDAFSVPKSEPTVSIGPSSEILSAFKRSMAIHEFGHVLGLEHEHQRPCFWNVASKHLDVEKIKSNPLFKGTNLEVDYFLVKQKMHEEVLEKDYDPDSIMHYWFDVSWLKNEKHRTLQGVETDPGLTNEEKKILTGIHKRHRNMADRPSVGDYTILERSYVASKERDKYLDKLAELMKAEGTIPLHYLKLYFIGMSGLGKTTFRKRLTQEFTNISSLPPEERQRCSTYLAECTQVLAVLSGSRLEMKASESIDKETQLLFQYLYSGRTGESDKPSNKANPDQLKNPPTPSTGSHEEQSKEAEKQNVDDSTSSKSSGEERAEGAKELRIDTDRRPKVNIKEIFARFRGIVGSGEYAKELLGKILLNLIDMGGQPGFLEMLPFLSTGPGMYLVFFPLDKELDEQYEVSFERDGESITPYKAKYTIEETLSQILSAVSSIHTICDPVTEKWLSGISEEFLTVKPIATLLGTFKDEFELKIKKVKLKETVCSKLMEQMHLDETEERLLQTDLDHALNVKLGIIEPRDEIRDTIEAAIDRSEHKDSVDLLKETVCSVVKEKHPKVEEQLLKTKLDHALCRKLGDKYRETYNKLETAIDSELKDQRDLLKKTVWNTYPDVEQQLLEIELEHALDRIFIPRVSDKIKKTVETAIDSEVESCRDSLQEAVCSTLKKRHSVPEELLKAEFDHVLDRKLGTQHQQGSTATNESIKIREDIEAAIDSELKDRRDSLKQAVFSKLQQENEVEEQLLKTELDHALDRKHGNKIREDIETVIDSEVESCRDSLQEAVCSTLKKRHSVPEEQLKAEFDHVLDRKVGTQHQQGSTATNKSVEIRDDIEAAIDSELKDRRDSLKKAVFSKLQQEVEEQLLKTELDHALDRKHGNKIREDIGTAIDSYYKFKDCTDSKRRAKHKAVGRITKIFKGFHSKPPVTDAEFFEVDNFKGTQADIDPIREHLNSVFNGQLEKAKLPIRPAQLLFGIILRKEYGIVTLDECYQIGEELEMKKEDVDFTLRYLHHCVGALLYYPDCEDTSIEDQNKQNDENGVKFTEGRQGSGSEGQEVSHNEESGEEPWFVNNVICSPQIVFDSISGLIVKALRELPSASTVDSEKTNWSRKGQFSENTIDLCLNNDSDLKKQVKCRKIIPVKKLIILLKHVNLLSPISTKNVEGKEVITYFMPAVLDCASKEVLLQCPQVDDDNPSPILITFEREYVPIGLFCATVTRLVSRGCKGILGMEWKLMDTDVKRNFVSFQIDNRHEVTLISHVRCYELRISRKNHKIDFNELCTYVLSTVHFVLKEISKQVKPQVAFECLCVKHRSRSIEKRDLSNLCELSKETHPCFECEEGTVDLQDSQNNWLAKDAQLCRNTLLKVFPFAGAQHLSDFTFSWKRNRAEKGTENELPIEKVTADDCTGYFCCEVSKNGTPYFTSYHSLKKCMMSFFGSMTCDDVCLWLEQNSIPEEDVQKFKEEKIDGGTFIDLPCDQGKLREELKLTRGGANKIAKLLLSEEVQSHTPGSDHKEEKGKLSQPMKKHPSGSYGTDLQAGSQPNQYGNYQGQQTQFMGQNAPNVQPGFQPNQYGNYQGQQTQFTGQSVPNVQPGFQPNQYGNNQGQQTQFTGQNVPNVQPGSQPNQYGNYQGQQTQFTRQSVPNFQPGFQPNQYGNYQGQQTQFAGQSVPNVQPGSQPNQYGNYQGQQTQFAGQNVPNVPPGFQPNPGTGIVLSDNKHLRHVKNALLDAAYLWFPLGQALGIPPGTLKSIKFEGELHDDNDRLNEVLSKWMHSGQATIDQLLEALVDPSVKRGDIANEIRLRKGEERSKVGLRIP